MNNQVRVNLRPEYGTWAGKKKEQKEKNDNCKSESKFETSNFDVIISRGFKQELSAFFSEKQQKVSFLELNELFENYQKKAKISYKRLQNLRKPYFSFVLKKYPNKLPDHDISWYPRTLYDKFMEKIRKRYISGMIVINERNELLAIINTENKLNLPKGNQSQCDRGRKNRTAVRECFEETNLKLSKKERKLLKKHTIYCLEKQVCLYHTKIKNYLNDDKTRVNLNYMQDGETYGMVWIPLADQNAWNYRQYKGKRLTMLLSQALRLDLLSFNHHFNL